ncbi:DUF6881 domain-containing protein [Streptomyces sudanensis]|uniref:DUF6881 domain-containing protein n=1 Tax=Streptomyces sudanensis TaxID=436397 RepID=UPI003558074F
MRCAKVTWGRKFIDYPMLYLSGLGGDGYEARKVQFYRDGRSEGAGGSHEDCEGRALGNFTSVTRRNLYLVF